MAGASVVVARHGQTILAQSFGQADLELDVPMPADASFEIGSVTKQFTASAILLLAERGKLAIDDELTKYLPDFPVHNQRITIRHLLTHTSGIKGYTELPEFGDLMPLRKSPETLVKLFADKPLDFAPGENLVYNNSAYFLLGLIIEKVSGQKYADFVKANLFDKVGMPGSYYCSESAIHHHHAHGYDTFANTLVLKGAISHAWPFSAGSLCSTAADLTAWNVALHGGKVLSAESYRAMTTPATLADGTKTRYGFGVMLSDLRGHRAISHGGGINGFLSEVEYLPGQRTLDRDPSQHGGFRRPRRSRARHRGCRARQSAGAGAHLQRRSGGVRRHLRRSRPGKAERRHDHRRGWKTDDERHWARSRACWRSRAARHSPQARRS